MKQHILSIWLIVIVSTTLYANTLKNDFVYDDEYTVVKNTLIKDLSKLPLLFSKNDYFILSGEQSYRPIVTFSYFVDYALYGLKPWGFHLTNILLHAANGVLLYTFLTLIIPYAEINSPILTRFFLSKSLIISLLFVTHPILTEAVNAISYREDLMAFLFYMATFSIYLYIRNTDHALPVRFLYSISCLLYILALFSKEMAVTLPLVIYCYEWIYSRKTQNFSTNFTLNLFIGYVCITIVYGYIRFYLFYHPSEVHIVSDGAIERIATLPSLLIKYFSLFILPFNLSADYIIEYVYPFSEEFFLSLSMLSIPILLAVATRKRNKEISFGLFFIFLALIPVYNFMPIDNPFAERYGYFACAGFAMTIGSAIHQRLTIAFIKQKTFPFYLLILLAIILSSYSTTTIRRNEDWKDDYSLWFDTYRKVPGSERIHNNLGKAYQNQGHFDKAEKEYLSAIKLNPYNYIIYCNLGNVYYSQGRLSEAINQFSTAARIDPEFAEPHYYLGMVYKEQGRLDEALSEYLTAIKLKPDHAEAHHDLAFIYQYHQGLLTKAVEEYLVSIKLNPDYIEAHNNLGVTYFYLGRLDAAISEYLTAIRLKPDHVMAHNNLGIAYLEKGQIDKAIKEFLTALQFKPNDAGIHYNLGDAYKKKELKNEALNEYKLALKLDPAYTQARFAIASLDAQ